MLSAFIKLLDVQDSTVVYTALAAMDKLIPALPKPLAPDLRAQLQAFDGKLPALTPEQLKDNTKGWRVSAQVSSTLCSRPRPEAWGFTVLFHMVRLSLHLLCLGYQDYRASSRKLRHVRFMRFKDDYLLHAGFSILSPQIGQ